MTMSDIELTKRAITPEELNEHLAQRDRPPQPKRPSEADTYRLIGGFVARDVDKAIDKAVAPLKERIAQLEKQIEKIERRKYVGVWATGKYFEGQMTTMDGSVWHCNVDGTEQRPGTGPDWTLAVKHGRDASRQPTAQRSHGPVMS
jgi:hypothetical protein